MKEDGWKTEYHASEENDDDVEVWDKLNELGHKAFTHLTESFGYHGFKRLDVYKARVVVK